jgi:ribosomal protein S18 acetylase RimI-like enzyme
VRNAITRVELRTATGADRGFLVELYASTRADELAVVPWTDDEKAAFVAMQFEAQDVSYHRAYPDGRFLVVLGDDAPIGRLYLGRGAAEIRIVDITLLPAHRGAGIGSRLIDDVLAEADAAGLAVRLHVEPWNPALRLYERRGFRVVEAGAVYLFMERPPVS